MSKIKRFCFALDLKDDAALIAEYKRLHQPENAWPAITKSIKDAGIVDMEIFSTATRLFMIMDVDDSFDPEKKAASDQQSPEVQKWEALMWEYQQSLAWAKPGEKWVEMDLIYKLST